MTTVFPGTSMPDRDWWSVLWPDPAAVLSAIGIRPDMTVLDLCCGDGLFTAPLARLVGGRVHALDIDPAMLDAARAEVARHGADVAGWIEADAADVARHLPGKVDLVLMANTFHGVPDQPTLLAAIRGILAPSGLFGVVNWHARPREETPVLGQLRGPRTEMRMSPEMLRAVVEPAGFKRLRLVELPPYHYGATFEVTP